MAVWLAEDDVPRCAPLPSSNLVPPSGRWRHARVREHCCGEPGSGGYAPGVLTSGVTRTRHFGKLGMTPIRLMSKIIFCI